MTMYTKVNGEQQVQILSPNFSISPSSEDYVLNISANGRDFSPLFAVSAGVTRLVSNVAPGSYYKLVGNQSEVVINWQRMCASEGGGDSSELQPIDYFPLDAVEGTVISYTGSSSASGVYQFDGNEWTEVGGNTEEIELPIAAAVNDLKGNIEARLNQQYYKKKEVDNIAARKTEPGQVDAQIKNYVDPAIAEVNGNIENKELATSAALNDLNQKINEIPGGSGGDMSAYWTSAQTEEAISAAASGKADAANISGRTQEGNSYFFPWYNEQGIITGDTRVFKENWTIHLSDGASAAFPLFRGDNYGFNSIYVANKPGVSGQIAKSNGKGFTWADDDKVSSTSISTIWKGTQSEYDAITEKDPSTFYIIVNN